ncbi:hypothetical protein ACWKSP_29210 [Micromonosporaceae bacterium Da 78-11]
MAGTDKWPFIALGQEGSCMVARTLPVTACATVIVYAVRLEWPDGTHQFVGPEPDLVHAELRADSVQMQWRQGFWRPRPWAVAMGANDFVKHARLDRDCTDQACLDMAHEPAAS